MCCNGKKDERTKVFELKFMNMCTEGVYEKPELLDDLWDTAVAAGHKNEVLNAKNEVGDLPIHITAENGNPTVMEWIVKKWNEENVPLSINTENHTGRQPLFLCCLKGYIGAESVFAKLPMTKTQRL